MDRQSKRMDKKMKITISNKLTISEDPEFLESVIQDRLTFANPKYLDNLKMNRWNGETPEYLKFYDYTENGDMILPRGFISQLVSLCRHYGSEFKIEDRRRILPEVEFTFEGQLRPFQMQAFNAMLSGDFEPCPSPQYSTD